MTRLIPQKTLVPLIVLTYDKRGELKMKKISVLRIFELKSIPMWILIHIIILILMPIRIPIPIHISVPVYMPIPISLLSISVPINIQNSIHIPIPTSLPVYIPIPVPNLIYISILLLILTPNPISIRTFEFHRRLTSKYLSFLWFCQLIPVAHN